MHMQGNTVNGFATRHAKCQGTWQLAVANGSYDVELGVGDADRGSDPTSHAINARGHARSIDSRRRAARPAGPLQGDHRHRSRSPTVS